jgi:pyruvate/2-oxoglutarate dehydrogenase complex dihydrolipoamide dehydrogenase (E3) component
MAAYDFDIGVIGGGAAGLTVASGSAQAGAKTLLIEKEKMLGGDCLHYGCVPSKTLIRTAHVYHLIRNARRFGLPELAVPSVDFRDVAARIRTVIDEIERHDSVERFCRLGVRVEFGTPAFVDDHALEVGGRIVSARTWVIATGSSPAVPPIEGLERIPYITNREVFSLDRLPRSMIILGAGPIAIEMAQAFNRLGTEVSVVQRGGQILSREDRDMADLLMEVLSAEGVRFHLQSTVTGVRDLGHARQVEIASAEDGKRVLLQAETIFVAMGRAANAGGLGLERIGIAFDRKGIPVDKRLRTSLKHVYAAGDVTGQYLFTHAAGYEGGVVVGNAVFHLPRKVDYTFLPWCTYTDPELASIGVNEKSAEASGRAYSVRVEEFRNNDRALAEGERIGRVKMILDGHERPIGIQIIGPRAGELISEWVAVLNGKVKIATLAAAVHPYPTLGEINKKVAGGVIAEKIFSEKVKKGLKLFFGFKGRACEPGRCHR